MEMINKYRLNQEEREYYLTTSVLNENVIRIECQDTKKEGSPKYSKDFTLEQLKQIDAVFGTITTIREVMEYIDKALGMQKVGITEESGVLKIIFYVTHEGKTHQVIIPLDVGNVEPSTIVTTRPATIFKTSVLPPIYQNTPFDPNAFLKQAQVQQVYSPNVIQPKPIIYPPQIQETVLKPKYIQGTGPAIGPVIDNNEFMAQATAQGATTAVDNNTQLYGQFLDHRPYVELNNQAAMGTSMNQANVLVDTHPNIGPVMDEQASLLTAQQGFVNTSSTNGQVYSGPMIEGQSNVLQQQFIQQDANMTTATDQFQQVGVEGATGVMDNQLYQQDANLHLSTTSKTYHEAQPTILETQVLQQYRSEVMAPTKYQPMTPAIEKQFYQKSPDIVREPIIEKPTSATGEVLEAKYYPEQVTTDNNYYVQGATDVYTQQPYPITTNNNFYIQGATDVVPQQTYPVPTTNNIYVPSPASVTPAQTYSNNSFAPGTQGNTDGANSINRYSSNTGLVEGRCSCPLNNQRIDRLEGDAVALKEDQTKLRDHMNKLVIEVNNYKNQIQLLNLEKERLLANSKKEEIDALRSENQTLRSELLQLNGAKSQAAEIQVLRAQLAELDPLRRKVAEMEVLRGQLLELNSLRAKVAELNSLKPQLSELNSLRAQAAEMEKLRAQLLELNNLRLKASEVDSLRQKIHDLELMKIQLEQEILRFKAVPAQVPPEEKKILISPVVNTPQEPSSAGMESKQLIFEDKPQQISVKGDIIHNTDELEMLTRKMNKYNKKLTLNLLYKATADSDKAAAFHAKCDAARSSLVLVETTDGKRFGGFTTNSWAGDCIDKKDEDAFVFSLDKMMTYDNIPGEDAVGCYPKFGPIFLGCQIRIYDNAFSKGGTTFEKGLNYNTEEDFELTGGQRTFNVKEIEVYEVIPQ